MFLDSCDFRVGLGTQEAWNAQPWSLLRDLRTVLLSQPSLPHRTFSENKRGGRYHRGHPELLGGYIGSNNKLGSLEGLIQPVKTSVPTLLTCLRAQWTREMPTTLRASDLFKTQPGEGLPYLAAWANTWILCICLTFYNSQLSPSCYRKELLNLDKLEAQLKACNCRLVFSKAKVRACVRLLAGKSLNLGLQYTEPNCVCVFSYVQPSILALCLLTLEVQTLKSIELFEIVLRIQKQSKVREISRYLPCFAWCLHL